MTDDEKIDEIINSLKNYGLADLSHNRDRPIAAFILGICLVDQISSFSYRRKGQGINNKCEKFFKTYIPKYSNLNLYRHFRNSIVHYYSSKNKFAVTNDVNFTKHHEKIAGKTIINTNLFIEEITNGFKKFEKELRKKKSNIRKSAISRYKKYPIIRHSTI